MATLNMRNNTSLSATIYKVICFAALLSPVWTFGYYNTATQLIPEAKPYHFSFEDSQTIGHQRALPFIDSKEFWTINGRQYLKSRSLNAFDHGFTKDSDQDVTDAMNALIQQVAEDPAVDTLYFPAARYYVSGSVYCRSGVNIIGAGQGKTIFERIDSSDYLVKGRGDFMGAVVANLTLENHERVLLMKDAANINFFHVEFKGGIVRFEKSKNLVFEGNIFNQNIGKAGYASSQCENVRIVNNTVYSIVKGGLNLSSHRNSYVAYNYITSPSLIDSGYAGIRLPNSAQNNLVECNYIQNHGRGLFLLSHSTGNTLQFNLIDATSYQGIFVQSPNNVIRGNVVKDAGDEAIIVINGTVQNGLGLSVGDHNHIVDNIIYDSKEHDENRHIGLRIATFDNHIEGNILSKKYGRLFKNIDEDAQNRFIGNRAIE